MASRLPPLNALRAFEAAARHLSVKKAAIELNVSAAPSFAARWLMPRLHRFIAAHPEVDVRVSARMLRVRVDGKGVVAERATVEAWLDDSDIAVLYGRGNYPGMWVKKLLGLTITPFCSPRLQNGEHP